MSIRKSAIGRTVILAALASVSMPALAQQAADAEETGAKAAGDDIVVTGSRLITDGSSSPTQVTVVTNEVLLQTTPSSVSDAMRKLPQFANSSSQSNSQAANSSFSASSYLNLRSIGPVRNLVLFDGNRLVPSSTVGAVDINTIPQMLIQRVDVATGGVSAVYGSDAVSGVVNFVIDRKFNGVKTFAQAGISSRGDNATQRLGVAAGTSFGGDRGHIEGSIEYFRSEGIESNKNRENGAARYTATGTGTAASPFRLTSNSRLGTTYSFGGRIVSTQNAAGATIVTPFTDTNFSTNGVLRPFVHGAATGTPGIESGGDGAYYESSLLSSLETKQAFLRLDYALTDTLNVHAQGAYTEADSVGVYIQPIVGGAGGLATTISASNAFLSPALQQQLAAAGVSTFVIRKFQMEVPRVVQDTNARNIFANIGFDGKIGSRFDWSVDYSHNEARRIDIIRGNGNTGRLWAALDAVVAPASYTGSDFLLNGQGQRVVCNVTLTNPSLYPGCLPLNVFGPSSEDQRASAFTRGDTRSVLTQKLDTVTATIKGSLFSLPAGEVRVAVNGEYRKQTLLGDSTNQPTALTSCTGLRFNCNPAAPVAEYRQNVIANSRGEVSVKEVGGEILVPILADAPFAKSLNLTGAVRYTDYSTSGGVTTWKAGLDWHVTDDLSFRATRSRDIRAPTVYELFGPQQFARSGYNDILTNTNDTVQVIAGSNAALAPEKADTFTVGGVYKPRWLPGLSIAVDYFNIKIKDAISLIDGTSATVQRQCIDSGFTSAVCSLYVRPLPNSNTTAANYPTRVLQSYVNAAREKTSGVDVDVIYKDHFLGGDWNFRVIGTYQPTYTRVLFAGDPLLNNAGVDGLPKYRVTGFLGYAVGAFSIDTQTTWHSATKHSALSTVVFDYPDSPAKAFTDLTVTYDIPTGTSMKPQFFVTVSNLFDTTPGIFAAPAGTPGFGPITTNGEDPVGRYFTAGFRTRF
ncbi:TonB-dependent receptor [Novosphingobium sp. PS1R-30]|uniref:TonB-dependent receptor n=1 Tax=Novosphingobium anseongense TaxID=3133436 RepID=A0ABU8S1H5_9SPHN